MKDRREIALKNTSKTLGKKFLKTNSQDDYNAWQDALHNYTKYLEAKAKRQQLNLFN
jgi:hypothetical protein